jgi:hypothetical protein
MDPQYYKILIFSLWILLPILPAFILYKFLPGNVITVKGPFKGLKVDMAGAFAGYFLLFIGCFLLVKQMIFEKPDRYEVWTVKAMIYDEYGVPLSKIKNKPDVSITPPADIDNGIFEFHIPVEVNSDYYNFPSINFTAFSTKDAADLRMSDKDIRYLLSPDVKKGQKNGYWNYDFAAKILTYDSAVRLIRVTSPVENTENILVVDSLPIQNQ